MLDRMKTPMLLGSVIVRAFASDRRERTPEEAEVEARERTFDDDEPLVVERELDVYLVSRVIVPLTPPRATTSRRR